VRRGRIYALSGVDCAGKSTQRDLLEQALRLRGESPLLLYVRPGSTSGLRRLKRLVRRLRGKRANASGAARAQRAAEPGRYPRRAANLGHPLWRELWLASALLDLLWTCCVRTRLARLFGRSVLCNRYVLDSLVDFRVNFPEQRVERRLLGRLLVRWHARPDEAYCFTIPPELTDARARAKARRHWETPEVLATRWRAYESLARELGVQMIDGTRAPDEIARSLAHRLPGRLPGPALPHGRTP
jgi:thymidylate kinase